MNFESRDAYFVHLRSRWSQTTLKSAALMTFVAHAESDEDADRQLREEGGYALSRLLASSAKPERHHVCFEIGCGAGRVATELAQYLDRGRYHGFDLAPGYAEICRRRAPGGVFSVTNGYGFPAEAGQADRIVSFAVFCHMPYELVYLWLREVRRALAPGGRTYLQFHNLASRPKWAEFEENASSWRFVTDPAHPRGMTLSMAELLHKKAGLNVVDGNDIDHDEDGAPRSWFLIAEAA